ncbi:hypothetical protein [Nostocoides vanveenii]
MRLPRRDIDPYAVLAQLDPTLAGALLVEVGEGGTMSRGRARPETSR